LLDKKGVVRKERDAGKTKRFEGLQESKTSSSSSRLCYVALRSEADRLGLGMLMRRHKYLVAKAQYLLRGGGGGGGGILPQQL
jgi:hypothetical protein